MKAAINEEVVDMDKVNRNEIVTTALTDDEEIYKENIIDHYKFPRNKRQMENPTAKHREHNPLCGDDITLFLRINNERVDEVSFIGDGCAISQASVSMLTDYVKGKTVEEIKKLSEKNVLGMLGIQISPARMKCALLSLKALKEGVKQKTEITKNVRNN